MRLIFILISLVVIAYLTMQFLEQPTTAGDSDKASEYIDQAKQNTEAINEAIKKQQELLKQQSKQ